MAAERDWQHQRQPQRQGGDSPSFSFPRAGAGGRPGIQSTGNHPMNTPTSSGPSRASEKKRDHDMNVDRDTKTSSALDPKASTSRAPPASRPPQQNAWSDGSDASDEDMPQIRRILDVPSFPSSRVTTTMDSNAPSTSRPQSKSGTPVTQPNSLPGSTPSTVAAGGGRSANGNGVAGKESDQANDGGVINRNGSGSGTVNGTGGAGMGGKGKGKGKAKEVDAFGDFSRSLNNLIGISVDVKNAAVKYDELSNQKKTPNLSSTQASLLARQISETETKRNRLITDQNSRREHLQGAMRKGIAGLMWEELKGPKGDAWWNEKDVNAAQQIVEIMGGKTVEFDGAALRKLQGHLDNQLRIIATDVDDVRANLQKGYTSLCTKVMELSEANEKKLPDEFALMRQEMQDMKKGFTDMRTKLEKSEQKARNQEVEIQHLKNLVQGSSPSASATSADPRLPPAVRSGSSQVPLPRQAPMPPPDTMTNSPATSVSSLDPPQKPLVDKVRDVETQIQETWKFTKQRIEGTFKSLESGRIVPLEDDVKELKAVAAQSGTRELKRPASPTTLVDGAPNKRRKMDSWDAGAGHQSLEHSPGEIERKVDSCFGSLQRLSQRLEDVEEKLDKFESLPQRTDVVQRSLDNYATLEQFAKLRNDFGTWKTSTAESLETLQSTIDNVQESGKKYRIYGESTRELIHGLSADMRNDRQNYELIQDDFRRWKTTSQDTFRQLTNSHEEFKSVIGRNEDQFKAMEDIVKSTDERNTQRIKESLGDLATLKPLIYETMKESLTTELLAPIISGSITTTFEVRVSDAEARLAALRSAFMGISGRVDAVTGRLKDFKLLRQKVDHQEAALSQLEGPFQHLTQLLDDPMRAMRTQGQGPHPSQMQARHASGPHTQILPPMNNPPPHGHLPNHHHQHQQPAPTNNQSRPSSSNTGTPPLGQPPQPRSGQSSQSQSPLQQINAGPVQGPPITISSQQGLHRFPHQQNPMVIGNQATTQATQAMLRQQQLQQLQQRPQQEQQQQRHAQQIPMQHPNMVGSQPIQARGMQVPMPPTSQS